MGETSTTTPVVTQTLGYPRIGHNRELKRALEGYWRGRIDEQALRTTFWQVANSGWEDQKRAGIDRIGVGGETLYDHVLDWTVRLGLIPKRFRDLEGLERYFAMARGQPGIAAFEMTKWFDTNYHYLVPEIEPDMEPAPDFSDFLELLRQAQTSLGDRAVPIVIGPLTFAYLSRTALDLDHVSSLLLPAYRDLLGALSTVRVPEVQFHEPVLVLSDVEEMRSTFERIYGDLAGVGIPINLVTYFDDVGAAYPWLVHLPVDVISLDLTRGDNLGLIQKFGWPQDKTLAAGLVDGRSVWRVRPQEVQVMLDTLAEAGLSAASGHLRFGISCSLQHVPYEVGRETALPDPLRGVLAFAREKLGELTSLARGAFTEAQEAWDTFYAFSPADETVQERVHSLSEADFQRAQPYDQRRPLQVSLPLFPTTTIGSYPQTPEVRRLRARLRRGEISLSEYEAGIDAFIAYAVGVQDGLGLDVIVHGEFERSDMVEYFAQKLTGFAFTQHGWVQSFGSRYVRPPIIFGDVARREAMTVREFVVAQRFTHKPVKGMLTGPVTILNWSYPRIDVPHYETAYQIALALRDEIADLEAAGARVIQVDEPALREGLPLKRERWEEYLTWAVKAFRLATAKARPETQVHTHMCYAEFGDILASIEALDADVISIENARSDDATLRELAEFGYPREVGPGVYDIHSPVVPSVEFIEAKLRSFVRHLSPQQIWVNPDCGLKTRAWEEVIPSLRNMIKAVRRMREAFAASPQDAPTE